jgi:hypothetical protein
MKKKMPRHCTLNRRHAGSLLALLLILPLVNVGTPMSSANSGNPWVSAYYAGWYWDWHPTPAAAVDAVDMAAMTHFIFGRYAPGAEQVTRKLKTP